MRAIASRGHAHSRSDDQSLEDGRNGRDDERRKLSHLHTEASNHREANLHPKRQKESESLSLAEEYRMGRTGRR